jgi:hypothetical protein
MKKPKLKKIKVPKTLPKRLRAGKSAEERVSQAISEVPRITNDTVADHREDVLSSARKYIYPLQHSKHSIVRISVGLFIFVIVGFLGACALDLYSFQGNSGFIYDVTRILPFPVGKVGRTLVSYESYLFELRRNMHYYHTEQQTDFSTKDGKAQLSALKAQAMDHVWQDTLINKLANDNHVKVSDQAVNSEVGLLKQENRLGDSDQVFKEVLSQYWGWSEQDFKRELKQQMLAQAVVAKLDTATNNRANTALMQLQKGTDFGTLASQISDDPNTKASGGQYPDAITIDDKTVPPAITDELFKLKPGQVSPLINTGFTLEILKVISVSGNTIHAAHIQFNFLPINIYLKPLESKLPIQHYIKV